MLKRKRIIAWLLATTLLNSSLVIAEVPAMINEHAPLFEPGYKPAEDTDEGGLWMVMNQYETELKTSAMLANDPQLQGYLEDIICKLSAEYCEEVRVYVIDNPHFNASMAPNGVMMVHTGLLLRLENEAQLASVLGHELAHYFKKHSLSQWRKIKSGSAVSSFLGLGLGVVGSLIGLGIMSSIFSYSRAQETEADMYGLELINSAGYDVGEAQQVWELVMAEEERAVHKRKKSTFFASHPSDKKRIAGLGERAEKLSFFENENIINSEGYQNNTNAIYPGAMGAMVKARQFGRIEYLLERHKNSAMPRGPYYYFKGELHRHRKQDGDMALAVDAYTQSLENDGPYEAYRDRGYSYWKSSDKVKARQSFQQYLDKVPDASDKAMIEFYLEKRNDK